ncbi:MAG TPA: response regulator [Prolixibacteraceae bacterium]|jgi:pilus assembly protein CpaE
MIDDEPVFYKMAASVLTSRGYELEYVRNGKDGLAAIASFKPELIIADMRMPDMSGFEILQSIRHDPRYHHIPVIFLTSVKTLEDKLKAFELGADDYLIKPFEPEELAARMDILARRARAIQLTTDLGGENVQNKPTIVAVHSLRGGSGVSSLAVNLALANYQIWEKPTLLIDTSFFASQVSMLLNMSPRNTMEKFTDYALAEIDEKMINELISTHSSGLQFIAAPRFPIATDIFTDEFWDVLFRLVSERYTFIVIDTPHDFSDSVISTLIKSDIILLVIEPEMASLRVAVSALKTYDQLGFPTEKVKLVLNQSFPSINIDKTQLQKAMGRPFDFEIPYEPAEVLRAINLGTPFMLSRPDLPISKKIEDLAYTLSSEFLKYIPPSAPTKAWKRVTARVPAATKKP